MKLISLQPAPVVDHITADGQELTQRPYPINVWADGSIAFRDHPRAGDPVAAVGFQHRADVQRIDLWWADVVDDPERAVGRYLVTSDGDGLSVHLVAIESVRVLDLERT